MDSCGISFSDLSPVPFVSSAWMDTDFPAGTECAASISDTNGNLLFYTNGPDVWNRNYHLMPNGSGLETNNSVTQGALIIPKPEDSIHYYILNLQQGGPKPGFYYSIVNMQLDDGKGDVEVNKKNIWLDSMKIGEKLFAIRHANGRDWWIINRETSTNKFYIYLLTPDSIYLSSIQSVGANADNVDPGELNFSSDGSKMVAGWQVGKLYLYNFDRCTGTLSNPVDLSDESEDIFYGNSFSPDGSKLYASSTVNLYQFDMDTDSIMLSRQLVWHNPYYDLSNINNSYLISQHQLASNGKIYIALGRYDYSNYADTFIDKSLCVINKPNELGAACDFVTDAFYLGGQHSGFGLPNSPNYNLGRLVGSPCDTLFYGVSNIVTPKNEVSVFPNPAIDKFTVKFNGISGTNEISLYELFGRCIYTSSFVSSTTVPIKNFEPGVYLYEVREKNLVISRGKLVKM